VFKTIDEREKKKNSCKSISDALSNTTSIFADPAQDMDEHKL
jgi:hypothetical protein